MADRRPSPFAVIVGLAVLVRVVAVLALQSHYLPHSTYEHGEIAENLLNGRGFSVKFLGADGPTSQQAPVYPIVVATAYAIGGIATPRSLLILQLGQAVLGGLLAAGTMALAREVAPGRLRVALGAGLIAALHPTLVYAATHVQVALPAATLLTWTFVMGYRAGRTGLVIDAALGGALFGLLALTDPILGLSAPALGAAVALGSGLRKAFRPLLISGAVAGLCLIPWTVRNYQVHGELIAVKSTFGYAFWQGNCALSEGTDKVVRPSVERALNAETGLNPRLVNASLWEARHAAGYLDDIALTADDYRELSALSETERSRRLFRRAVTDLREGPWRFPNLTLRRLRFFLLFDETNPKTRNFVYRASHLGLTALAVLGLVLAPSWLRRRLAPTLLAAAAITAFHALTIVSARFHVPIEPLMGLWAACGIATLEKSPAHAGPRLSARARDVVGVGVEVGLVERRGG